jgi:amidase
MNRRNFLKNGSLTGFTLSSLALESFVSPVKDKNSNPDFSHQLATGEFALLEITIDELQQKMNTGEYSSTSITKMYLKRIAEIDKKGPALNAVIELNPDALAMAENMDAERKAGKTRGPLHGIPVLIKDNINSGDRMMTTAGSLALEGHRAEKDAFIVKQLREAGAVLLGKMDRLCRRLL